MKAEPHKMPKITSTRDEVRDGVRFRVVVYEPVRKILRDSAGRPVKKAKLENPRLHQSDEEDDE